MLRLTYAVVSIFVGSGESDEFGGRIGVALGDIGYNGSLTTLYIEFVRKSGTMPGCTVPADGLIAGGPGTQDDTWVFYPGNGGLVVPTIQPGRWYRIASIAGKRNDGGISVTASWTDIVSGDQRAISYDFPASCTANMVGYERSASLVRCRSEGRFRKRERPPCRLLHPTTASVEAVYGKHGSVSSKYPL